jgi:hypothetical protein
MEWLWWAGSTTERHIGLMTDRQTDKNKDAFEEGKDWCSGSFSFQLKTDWKKIESVSQSVSQTLRTSCDACLHRSSVCVAKWICLKVEETHREMQFRTHCHVYSLFLTLLWIHEHNRSYMRENDMHRYFQRCQINRNASGAVLSVMLIDNLTSGQVNVHGISCQDVPGSKKSDACRRKDKTPNVEANKTNQDGCPHNQGTSSHVQMRNKKHHTDVL